jgi:hypothetical protein
MRPRRAASAAAVCAVLLAGCGDEEQERPDPEQVTAAAADYAHAFGEGDGERACSLLTPAAQKELTERVSTLVGTRDCPEAIQKLQAVAGPNVTGPFQEAKASEPKVTGDTATVTLTAGSGSEEVKLERVDGEWLLTRAPGT